MISNFPKDIQNDILGKAVDVGFVAVPMQTADGEECAHLVVVAVGDGIGLNPCFLHLEEDPDGQDWLAVLSAQLQQHAVAHLGQTAGLYLNKPGTK